VPPVPPVPPDIEAAHSAGPAGGRAGPATTVPCRPVVLASVGTSVVAVQVRAVRYTGLMKALKQSQVLAVLLLCGIARPAFEDRILATISKIDSFLVGLLVVLLAVAVGVTWIGVSMICAAWKQMAKPAGLAMPDARLVDTRLRLQELPGPVRAETVSSSPRRRPVRHRRPR
jgi:hypothetical protein